jgi:hypothetical protein
VRATSPSCIPASTSNADINLNRNVDWRIPLAAADVQSTGARARVYRSFIGVMWIVLGMLMLTLFALAAVLLIKSKILSSDRLTATQTESVWAFLGVSLGAIVTLIGMLLTEQQHRRTVLMQAESALRERQSQEAQADLARQSEKRLTVDLVAKVLELITIEGAYAPKARIAGALTTMMQLGGGAVGIRVLRELWIQDNVDSETAVWLIDGVLRGFPNTSQADEVCDAGELLELNASKLVPSVLEEGAVWYLWPNTLAGSWRPDLPADGKNAFILAAVQMLLAREREWWNQTSIYAPIETLMNATQDSEVGDTAAKVMVILLDLGVLPDIVGEIDASTAERWRSSDGEGAYAPWFEDLLSRFEPWSRGEAVKPVPRTAAAAGLEARPARQ